MKTIKWSAPALTAIPRQRDHRADDFARLLSAWQAIAACYVSADAHDDPLSGQLLDQLTAVEEALADRHRDIWRQVEPALLQAVMAWEHLENGATGLCPLCRRLALGLPLDLPSPAKGDR